MRVKHSQHFICDLFRANYSAVRVTPFKGERYYLFDFLFYFRLGGKSCKIADIFKVVS